jgi:hypothetical protein
MKALFSTACLAAAFVIALPAQSSQGQTTPDQKETQKAQILTVTGCLRAGIEANSFVLSDLQWIGSETPAGTTGTPPRGAPPAAASAVTLRLVGAPGGVRLSEHVGHKVEITGSLIDEAVPIAGPAAIARAGTGTGGDQTSRTGEAKSQAQPEPTLNVRTVKMIADKCQ